MSTEPIALASIAALAVLLVGMWAGTRLEAHRHNRQCPIESRPPQ